MQNTWFKVLLFSGLFLIHGCNAVREEAPHQYASPAYSEQHRPQLHFSPPSMWMNDPNGLVFYKGEYHLFYQYYPEDIVWGPMHWGHAVSMDLVHWQNLPIALYPDELGYIFSGSAVVDWNNSSGFGVNGEPPLVAIFTYHDPELGATDANNHEYQGIAYSTDEGRSWTKYRDNPVLPNTDRHRDFRDPDVFWHEPTQRWVMVLSVADHVQFYNSPDLKQWDYLSSFGAGIGGHDGVWECPDLFRIPVSGSDEEKWVLIQNLNPGGPQGGSGTQYFVGNFDGVTFTLDPGFAQMLENSGPAWLDWGRDNYAGVTWSDIPASDGRRIFIGWMSNWDYAQQVPTVNWRSAMTLPRTLSLHRIGNGYRVFSEPVEELAKLRNGSYQFERKVIAGKQDMTSSIGFPITTSEIRLEFKIEESTNADFGIELSNWAGETYLIGFDGVSKRFYSDRSSAGSHDFSDSFADHVHWAPRLQTGENVRMHIVFDVASVELFADDGATVLTDTFFPSERFVRMAFFSKHAPTTITVAEINHLEGIWK
jgi:fructan beta-fructosidase